MALQSTFPDRLRARAELEKFDQKVGKGSAVEDGLVLSKWWIERYKTGQLRSPGLPHSCICVPFPSSFFSHSWPRPLLPLLLELGLPFKKSVAGASEGLEDRDGCARRTRRQVQLNYGKPGRYTTQVLSGLPGGLN